MLQSAGLSIPALVPTCFEEPSYTNASRPQFQSVFQSKAQNYPSSARFVQEVRCSVNEENFANFLPDLQSSLSLPSWMPWHQRQSLPYFGHPHGGDPYYAYGHDMVDVDNPKSFPQKRKRARTTFSVEQLKKLEKRFQGNHYIVGDERLKISKDLNLSEAQVKVWFQNRRIKFKRDQELEKLGKTKKRKGEHHMRRWQLVTRNFGPETNELFCTARDRSEPFVL